MDDFFHNLLKFATHDRGSIVLHCLAIWLSAFVLLRVMRQRISARALHPQHRLLILRVVSLVGYSIAVVLTLQEFGVGLGALLGTAGVFTVAIGFAAQASTSNLISGLFLIFEQPFRVGDVVRVGEVVGEVISIGLVSVRLRTPDNLLVRIPNETMLKSNVINQTHYPVRRLELKLSVDYHNDIARVRQVVLEVVAANVLCLDEPLARVNVNGCAAAGVDLSLSVWVLTENLGDVRDGLFEAIKLAFDREGIAIPRPHTSFALAGDALPIRVLSGVLPTVPSAHSGQA